MNTGQVERRVERHGTGHRQHVLGRDARLVALDRPANRKPLGRHLRRLVEPGEVGPDPEAHRRATAKSPRGLQDARQLLAAVERDHHPGAHRVLEQRIPLHRPVERDRRRVGSGAKRGVELARSEHVASGTGPIEDPPQRQRRIGLERRQQQKLARPASAELRPEAMEVAKQLRLGDDVKWSAEAARQLLRGAIVDV
jgi:hypothetical protein